MPPQIPGVVIGASNARSSSDKALKASVNLALYSTPLSPSSLLLRLLRAAAQSRTESK